MNLLPWRVRKGSSHRSSGAEKYLLLDWRLALSALLLSASTALAVGSLRAEHWRALEATLLLALPLWTLRSSRGAVLAAVRAASGGAGGTAAAAAGAGPAYDAGVVPRRWLAENLLSTLHAVLLAGEVVAAVAAAAATALSPVLFSSAATHAVGDDASSSAATVTDHSLTIAFLILYLFIVVSLRSCSRNLLSGSEHVTEALNMRFHAYL